MKSERYHPGVPAEIMNERPPVGGETCRSTPPPPPMDMGDRSFVELLHGILS